jgi:hypothetical protein
MWLEGEGRTEERRKEDVGRSLERGWRRVERGMDREDGGCG